MLGGPGAGGRYIGLYRLFSGCGFWAGGQWVRVTPSWGVCFILVSDRQSYGSAAISDGCAAEGFAPNFPNRNMDPFRPGGQRTLSVGRRGGGLGEPLTAWAVTGIRGVRCFGPLFFETAMGSIPSQTASSAAARTLEARARSFGMYVVV